MRGIKLERVREFQIKKLIPASIFEVAIVLELIAILLGVLDSELPLRRIWVVVVAIVMLITVVSFIRFILRWKKEEDELTQV